MDYNKLYLLSGKILVGLQIIPILIGLFNFKDLDKPLKIFLSYCITFFILDLAVQILIYLVYNNWNYFKHIANDFKIKDFSFTSIFFYLNNFSLLGWFFILLLKEFRVSLMVKWISIALIIVSIINYLFIEGYRVIGVFNATADALYGFILPFIFMWYLFSRDSKVPISKNPYFWINLRLIVPNLVALILHFIGNKIQSTDKVLFLEISIAKNIIWGVGLIFACIGFYYARYTKYLPQNTPSVKEA